MGSPIKEARHERRASALAWAVRGAMLSLAITAALAPKPAQAADTLNSTARKSYAIAAGPLGNVLAQFAVSSGVPLSFDAGLLSGIQSPGLQGSYTLREGFGRLLSGTGYEMVDLGDGTYSLRKLPPEAQAGPVRQAASLPAVSVTAAVSRETAIGPVKGYVARRSATGTKTDSPLIESPQSVSVVTRDQMDAQGVGQVSDALRYTAGIVAEANGPDPRGEVFAIRGFAAGGASDIYRDGLRAASFSSNQGGVVVEPYGLERIELLRGPASVLYGQGNVGGLVNTVSKRPTLLPLHELQLQLGSHDRKQVAGDVGGALSEDGVWSYRLTGLLRDSGTQFDHVRNDRAYIAPAISWRPSDSTTLTLLTEYQKDKSGGSYMAWPRRGTLDSNPYGKIPSGQYLGEPDFDKFNQERASIGYAFEHAFNDTVAFRQNFRHMDLRTDAQFVFMGAGGLNADDRTINRMAAVQAEKVGNTSMDNQLQIKLAHGPVQHTLLLGLDGQRMDNHIVAAYGGAADLDVYAPQYGAQPVGIAVAQDERDVLAQTGLYLQDQVKFGESLVATLGTRRDWSENKVRDGLNNGAETRQKDQANTYRAGLVYLAPMGWAPYVSYAESFSPVAGRDAAGLAFNPEKGQQYEAGVRYQPSDAKMSVTASVFEAKRQHVTTTDPANLGYQVQRGEVRSRGFELEAKASLVGGLDALASYAYTSAKITHSNDGVDGNRPNGVPAQMAAAWLNYSLPAQWAPGWRVGAGLRHMGATFGDVGNNYSVPAYTLFDAAINIDLSAWGTQWKGWQLAVNASNLFDKAYISTCGYYGDGCKFGYRRNVQASLAYRW